jgi:hypothetical protein
LDKPAAFQLVVGADQHVRGTVDGGDRQRLEDQRRRAADVQLCLCRRERARDLLSASVVRSVVGRFSVTGVFGSQAVDELRTRTLLRYLMMATSRACNVDQPGRGGSGCLAATRGFHAVSSRCKCGARILDLRLLDYIAGGRRQ